MEKKYKKNSPLKKKDKILFYVSMGLLAVAVVLFAISCVLFAKSNGDSDHSRFFTACMLLFAGGISALGASVCLFLSPLMQARRQNVCPYCGAKVPKKSAFCAACGKQKRKRPSRRKKTKRKNKSYVHNRNACDRRGSAGYG